MKRFFLNSLLSGLLFGHIAYANAHLLTSIVIPTVAGAAAGTAYTSTKAYYGHRRYETYHVNTLFENTITHGARLVEQYQNGPLSTDQPEYMYPLEDTMLISTTAAGLFGICRGFYKHGFKDGCKIALGSVGMLCAAYAGISALQKYLKATYEPSQGPHPTIFTYSNNN